MANGMTERLLREMMWPSDHVFDAVVRAKNLYDADTGTIIRTLVSEFAKEKGIDLGWSWSSAKYPGPRDPNFKPTPLEEIF